MNYLIATLLLFLNLIFLSQTDTIVRKSLFSNSNQENIEVTSVGRTPKAFKNIISYDLLGILFGERKLSYDRLLTKKLFINLSIGYTKKDVIYNMSNFESIYQYKNDFLEGAESHEVKLGYVLSFGIKKYFKESSYGSYLSPVISTATFNSIAYERLDGSFDDDYEFTNLFNKNTRVISDFKIECGYSYYTGSHFYWNANIAAGVRKTIENYFIENDTYPQIYSYEKIKNKSNKPLITIGLKLGVAF